jgi:hypothetical protein
MGRPIGSVNRDKPFADALRVALLSGGGRRLRIIADKLAEKAEQGDLQAIPFGSTPGSCLSSPRGLRPQCGTAFAASMRHSHAQLRLPCSPSLTALIHPI